MGFDRLTRAMRNAASRFAWRDDVGVGELLVTLKPLDLDALSAMADACEREVERDTTRQMVDAAELLVERFHWPVRRILEFLTMELRERISDAEAADAEFRVWYAQWRRENPDA